ncbi:MAG: hypothetical protein ACRBBN_04975 [Methyloligellaceae bacterium]
MKHEQIGQLEKLATLRKNIAFAKMKKTQNLLKQKEQHKEEATCNHSAKKNEARNIIDNHFKGKEDKNTQNYSSRLSGLRAKVSQAYQDIDDARQSIENIETDIQRTSSILHKDKQAFREAEKKQQKIEILYQRLSQALAVVEASNQEADSVDSRLNNKK